MSDFSVKKRLASSKSLVAYLSHLAVTAYHIPLNKENKRTHSNSFVGYSMNRFFLRNHIKKYSRSGVFHREFGKIKNSKNQYEYTVNGQVEEKRDLNSSPAFLLLLFRIFPIAKTLPKTEKSVILFKVGFKNGIYHIEKSIRSFICAYCLRRTKRRYPMHS